MPHKSPQTPTNRAQNFKSTKQNQRNSVNYWDNPFSEVFTYNISGLKFSPPLIFFQLSTFSFFSPNTNGFLLGLPLQFFYYLNAVAFTFWAGKNPVLLMKTALGLFRNSFFLKGAKTIPEYPLFLEFKYFPQDKAPCYPRGCVRPQAFSAGVGSIPLRRLHAPLPCHCGDTAIVDDGFSNTKVRPHFSQCRSQETTRLCFELWRCSRSYPADHL